jgi:hypothetical protein
MLMRVAQVWFNLMWLRRLECTDIRRQDYWKCFSADAVSYRSGVAGGGLEHRVRDGWGGAAKVKGTETSAI